MTLHAFVFLLVFFLLFLALLWRLDWLHLRPSSRGGAKRSTLQRLLKPRSPDDCPACRLASPASSAGGPTPLPVRPWSEVKSRRGAPKRIDTQGFACPNPQCAYCEITDAHIHALVGDGKHGQAESIQTFRCQACRTTFTARRHTCTGYLDHPFKNKPFETEKDLLPLCWLLGRSVLNPVRVGFNFPSNSRYITEETARFLNGCSKWSVQVCSSCSNAWQALQIPPDSSLLPQI